MASISDKALFETYADEAKANRTMAMLNKIIQLADKTPDYGEFKEKLIQWRQDLTDSQMAKAPDYVQNI